jgi:Zn-dependent peptidase ImmA (M78 family)
LSSKGLSPEDCKLVEQHADDKITLYYKQNDILGEQIFDILKRNCRALFYPLEDDDVWGFYEKIGGHSFICINTSIDFDKQVFVAAHELYHLWYNHPEELILASDIEERDQNLSIEEKRANRFAAVFLVPEMLLGREIVAGKIDIATIEVQDIVKLARTFLVPYRTMVKRLCEIGKISDSKCLEFLNVTEDQVAIWRKRLGVELVKRTNNISLDVLVDKAISAFDHNQITRAKLEYLLSLASTTTKELGIPDEEPYVRPSEDELQALMED